MATGDGDGDDDGFCYRKRRCHGSGGDDDDGTERSRVAAGDFTYDDGAGDSMEDDDNYDYEADDDDGGCIGEGNDTCDDDDDPDDEHAVEEETKVAKPTYNVLTEDMILARQEKATANVAEVLSIPSGFAAVLLRHFKWRASQVQDEWFSDDRRVRDAVGLPADDGGVPVAMALSSRQLVCGICFTRFNAGRTRSAGCSHFYCDECWRGYVHAAVADGARCLSLRCPDPSCSAAVVDDLVSAVADGADRDRYARFALRSYVEQSGGGVKWCPAAGCTRAVEFVGADDGGDGGADVFCECAHGFCWSCGEEAHRPLSCGTVRAWRAKNASDSETANWVLTHTKHCPKCRRPIEKNHGCNHMTCSAPCYHQFCWLCFDPWRRHLRCARFDYSDYLQQDGDGDGDGDGSRGGDVSGEEKKERRQRRQAKASLDRYLYHYERWAGNGKSLQKALADMNELRSSGLEKMAASLEIKVEDLEFLTMAYELIAYGRRVMRWVYAYGYYLDPERDVCKRHMFDRLQDDANRRLEDLHHAAEVERMKFCSGHAGSDMNETYRAYKEQLILLTKVTRNYFGNLVKAFETDLPEINSVRK